MSYRTPKEIVLAAVRVTGASEEYILGPSMQFEAVAIRRAICLVGRRRALSYPQIGRAINRNHSTVFHHVNRPDTDMYVLQLVAEIEAYLRKPTWRDQIREERHAGPPA